MSDPKGAILTRMQEEIGGIDKTFKSMLLILASLWMRSLLECSVISRNEYGQVMCASLRAS